MDTVREMRKSMRVIERDALRQVAGELCCTGISLTQCHLLLEIEEGGMSPGELAEILRLDKSTLSRTVEKLVAGGVVSRKELDDRRYHTIELTPEGRRLVEAVNATRDGFYRLLLEAIPRSRHRSIIRALGEISSAIKKITRPAVSCCRRKAVS